MSNIVKRYHIIDTEDNTVQHTCSSLEAARKWLRSNTVETVRDSCFNMSDLQDPDDWGEPMIIALEVARVRQCPKVNVSCTLKNVDPEQYEKSI